EKRRFFPEAWVLLHIINANYFFAAKNRAEGVGGSRQGEMLKVFALRAGERVKHVRAAALIRNVVEESAELRPDQFGRRVRKSLHQIIQVKLSRKHPPGAIHRLDDLSLFLQVRVRSLQLCRSLPDSHL